MSDYFATPIPIPQGVTSPTTADLLRLYGFNGLPRGAGVATSSLPYASQLAGQLGGGGGLLPQGAGVATSELPYLSAASSAGGVGVRQALGNLYGATAGGEGLGSLGFAGVRAGFSRALPGLALAELGPKGINALPVGSRDQKDLLGNVVAGIGIGAAAGAPFEGIGAIPGAAIGGTAGLAKGLFEMFGGDDEPSTDDYKTSLSQAASQFGLDPTQYTAAFDLLSKSGVDSKALTTQLAQQVIQDGVAKKQQDQAIAIQKQQHASDQQFALAIQSQAAKFFTPYVNNIISSGKAQSDLLRGQADQLPEPYRQVFLNQAESALNTSQNIAGAYAAQSAMLPSQYMMSADLKRQQELAQLQYQQSVVNAQQGGGSGVDFSQLGQQAG